MTVRHGKSRTVLLVRRYAIKLPRLGNGWRPLLWGLLSNMAERDRYRAKPDTILCPVLLSVPGGWCNVMPRCADASGVDLDALPATLRTACGFDLKPCSFGWLDGRLVVLDYHAGVC